VLNSVRIVLDVGIWKEVVFNLCYLGYVTCAWSGEI